MIEKIIYDYLVEKMSPISVFMEIPSNPPTQFILIEKTGSRMNDRLATATIAIQSYNASLFEAATLNKTVKSAMAEVISLSEVTKCVLNSDYNYTDTATKNYRYQAVFDVYYY